MISDLARGRAPRWWLMAALMIGVFLSPFNVTFTSIALPTMRSAFSVDVEQVTWVGTAYFIPSVVLMPLQAAIGERWGVKRAYILGLGLLSAGGLLAVLARDFQQLLASRVLQGIGWSGLYPLALILIRTYFPAGRQGEMMGVWESAVGFATIVSPLIGGLLVEFYGWPSLYLGLSAIAALGALLALAAIPFDTPEPRERGKRFDYAGALSFTLAITAVLLGLSRKSPGLLLVSLVAAALWLLLARRARRPFIPPGLFLNLRFVSASAAANLRMLIAIAALTALPLFFEDVQGLSPGQVGAVMVTYSFFLFLGAWPGGRWADRAGARAPGTVGYLAMILGVLLLLGFDAHFGLPLAAGALAVRGLGAGLAQTPFAKAATDAVEPKQARMAAGLYGTLRYSGLALGSTLVGILLQSRLERYGALRGGMAALPAFRELWLVLAVLGFLGLGLAWLTGPGAPATRIGPPITDKDTI